MLKLKLPFWMQKGELKKLNNAAQSFWDRVEKWLQIPLSRFDLMTCDLILVDHIAWERKITRLNGEIESIYRKRVNYAFINAQDAGMNRGMYNIFERLGIAIFDIKERQPGKDWDIVTIEMSDEILSGHKTLVNLLIQTYGATCRRYEYSVTSTLHQYCGVGIMEWNHQTVIATEPLSVKIVNTESSIMIDTQLTLSCVYTGQPKPDIEWHLSSIYTGTKIIGYGDKIQLTEHQAAYYTVTCIAVNPSGSASDTLALTIKGHTTQRFTLNAGSDYGRPKITGYNHSYGKNTGSLTPVVINHQDFPPVNKIMAAYVTFNTSGYISTGHFILQSEHPIEVSITASIYVNGHSDYLDKPYYTPECTFELTSPDKDHYCQIGALLAGDKYATFDMPYWTYNGALIITINEK
ncbi:immunoglobulin domain-containing protein [Photobacterium piscicola]|uniref:immunoglobulin domain-containing protein n=1 Tax=Photobacterium piscicola TaxID=1378299 RepID=UPI003734D0D1